MRPLAAIKAWSGRKRAVYGCSSAVLLIVVVALVVHALKPEAPSNPAVLAAAYALPNGGGYGGRSDTGVPADVAYGGKTVLARSRKGDTYCCGFTFAVAMRVAAERGLMSGHSFEEVKRFQREWYGAVKESGDRLVTVAVKNLGIGREVDRHDARPGDFVQFWRTNDSGHSVVFLEWVVRDGQAVGIRYRSSQPQTMGVGDHVEFFAGTTMPDAWVDAKRIYVARLD